MKKELKTTLIVLSAVIAVLLVWGIIGGLVAQDSGVTCDTGIGKALCWKWHTNLAGQVGEFFNDLGNQQ
jgi:hypothetical protein